MEEDRLQEVGGDVCSSCTSAPALRSLGKLTWIGAELSERQLRVCLCVGVCAWPCVTVTATELRRGRSEKSPWLLSAGARALFPRSATRLATRCEPGLLGDPRTPHFNRAALAETVELKLHSLTSER
ncbi:hypothetical protein AMECASPLE_026877 [Ameca splendens]|uniref:Uncharacterized protein n=1 Tax=Ameca splendens TaxID=208324 RepID=A0ABV0ZS16_9TELE